MSIMDYFCDWQVSATIKTKTQTPDSDGHMVDTLSGTTVIKGTMHTLNVGERYFNILWANDITKVFKTTDITGLDSKKYLLINNVLYATSEPNNINEQGLLYLVGLKVHI